MKWSILVLTTPRRVNNFFIQMIEELQRQTAPYQDIEILGLYDNKKMSVGAKRNALLRAAKGEYISFIDDDDMLAPEYVSEIYKNLNDSVDVVTHLVVVTSNGQNERVCYYNLEYKERLHVGTDVWTGPPSHTMAWRRELVENTVFSDISMHEDEQWVNKVLPFAKTQINISKVLYYYKFRDDVTETR